jgi:predicted secreted protein
MERSKKIIFVSHCLLNQNARPIGGEKYPGSVKDLLEIFAEAGIGIVQLPCPQLEFNGGLNRKLKSKNAYDTKGYRKFCHKVTSRLIKQIENYIKKDYKVIGILGVEFSSTCGVHQVEDGRRNVPGKGIMIEELEEEMEKKNFQVPIVGVNLNNVFKSIERVRSLLKFT